MRLEDTRRALTASAKSGHLARALNILIVGEESAGIQLVRTLARGRHRIVGVLTSPDPSGKFGSLWSVAQNLALTTIPATQVEDPGLAEEIRAKKVDVLLNVHSLHIIHREVLSVPSLGSFNLHPGPLPRYAGLNCVSWALYHGESRYGVTLHKMEPEIDVGAIAGQALFEVEETDTALSLMLKCVRAGLTLIHELICSAAEHGRILMREQDLSERQYYGRQVPGDGWLDWSQPARSVFNFIRACDYYPFHSPWGFPKARLDGNEIGIIKATPLSQPTNVPPGSIGTPVGPVVRVACGDEWIGVKTVFARGKYRDARGVLHPGVRLE